MAPNSIVEKYSGRMIPFFRERLVEIEATLDPLLKEKQELEQLLADLQRGANSSRTPASAYTNGASYMDKVIYFTEREGWLSISDIATKIVAKEPELEVTKVKGTLSAVLAMEMKKENKRIQRKNVDGVLLYNIA